jgi:hypothetical protein
MLTEYQLREMSLRTSTPAEMVAAVKAHALTHYEQDGWDYVIECWEDTDILKAIGNARTITGALAAVRRITKAMNDRRRDIEGEIY